MLYHTLLLFLIVILTAPAAAAPKPEKLNLWNGKAPIGDGKFEQADASITVHRPDNPNGTAIVICPGGGYGGLVTGAEGHGIAAWLNRRGITGVVLEYRLPKGRHQVPLLDAQRAIRTVRSNAKVWGIDQAKVGIMGFSAGGHLASTAGTHFDNGAPRATDPIDRIGSRPDFMILVYPVITMGEKTHGGSRTNLLGKEPDPKLVELYSNEKQVTAKTPPTFLAHAKDDRPVVPDNSRMFYESLQKHGVPAKYLELPTGGHGLNGYKGPSWEAWQEQSLTWMAEMKLVAFAQEQPKEPVKTFTYKKTKSGDLAIQVHFPPDWKKDDKRPAIVFFFGGGWTSGTVKQFEPQARYFASRGMVTARADYRVKSRHNVGPDACVEDAKSAVRWLRQNAARLGIHPDQIVASGGSAGGHIAACTACPGLDADGEDRGISSKPNAMLLFNPVLRFDGEARLMARINNDEKLGKAISPTLHLTKETPPALLFYGDKDGLLKQGEEYLAKSKQVGHQADVFLAKGVGHGFFNRSPWTEKTLLRADEFLRSLGFLKGKPTVAVP
jgi:acetyl esterase/lipase